MTNAWLDTMKIDFDNMPITLNLVMLNSSTFLSHLCYFHGKGIYNLVRLILYLTNSDLVSIATRLFHNLLSN